jgi:ADP-dependent NAD(P)H-hydrate dehydratase / NAD(P)H-hydrate epimerase
LSRTNESHQLDKLLARVTLDIEFDSLKLGFENGSEVEYILAGDMARIGPRMDCYAVATSGDTSACRLNHVRDSAAARIAQYGDLVEVDAKPDHTRKFNRCPRKLDEQAIQFVLMILLNAAESRELDRLSQTDYGIASYTLMERAGEAVAAAILCEFADAARAGVLIVAGKGNNGGDGLVAARALAKNKVAANVVLLARADDLKGDAARAHANLAGMADGIVSINEALDEASMPAVLRRHHYGVVVDSIFGTGLNADVKGVAGAAIETMNAAAKPIIAVDIASGVNADTGAVMGIAVKAARTVTFGYAKYGHLTYPGAEFTGELEIADIGFAAAAIERIAPHGRFVERADAAPLIPRRAINSHKGTYGHPLIIAGGRGKAGAALIAARGALRMGAGLVTAAIPEEVAAIVAAGQIELMTEPIPDKDGHWGGPPALERLGGLIEGKDAIVVGPGLGVSPETIALIQWVVNAATAPDRPVLIDADGLNAIAQRGAGILKAARGPIVLTPHPGEMARLLGASTAAVNAGRISAARQLAETTGAVVLLKGARSVIAAPGGALMINSSGNPGMATPGMGDVLSGIVGALLGQKIAPAHALMLGVYIHGHAADRLARQIGPYGFLAGDLADELPATVADLLAR